MIISHKYRFIFLKTNKTAGTSIEIALSGFCGEEDVITPISPRDEETRRQLGHRGPQNHVSSSGDGRDFYNHMPASEVRDLLDAECWNGYFKFCFERNPWDRAISLYYWLHRSEPRPGISDFIRSDDLLRLKARGRGLYTIDGEVVVDRVCRYEALAEELEAFRRHVGIPGALALPRAKAGHRKDRRSYREVFDAADRAFIERLFDDEIRLMGYTW